MNEEGRTRILLTRYRKKRICARYVGFRMTDIVVCEPDALYRVGDIRIGKVTGIRHQMNAAFVSLGEGEDAWLNLEDLHRILYTKGDPAAPLAAGDEILVQITREAHGAKRMSLSANLMFSGRLVLLMTGKRALGISVKIPEKRKKELRTLLAPRLGEEYGLIVRSAAADASEDEILQELEALRSQVTEKLSVWRKRTAFSLLERGDGDAESFVLEHLRDGIDEILTDQPDAYTRMRDFCKDTPDLSDIPLRLYEEGGISLGKVYSLDTQIERALSRKVHLPSGAFLYIDRTEAMTVIDVNSGKKLTDRPHSKKSKREAVLEVNLEAARRIAREVRLRNLSGIIMIDFIDMEEREDQKKVLDALKEAAADDPAGVHVVDLTALQICEMTRKRVKKSLCEQLCVDTHPD